MPIIIGFLVALLLRPVINFASENLHVHTKAVAVTLILLFYGAAGFFVSWIGVGVISEIKDGIIKLPEIYSMNVEPVINQIFNNAGKMIAKLDPMLVQAIQDMAALYPNPRGGRFQTFLNGNWVHVIFGIFFTRFYSWESYLHHFIPFFCYGLQ